DSCNATGACIDRKKANGVVCLAGTLPCDPDDTCDGTTNACAPKYALASTACGDQTDTDCDHPNHCSGTDGSCVPNYAAAGAACGNAGTACRNADACDGAGGCTIGGFKSASTPCTGNLNGGACDGIDHCSGTDDTCVDAFKPSSHACILPTDAYGNYTCREVVYCTGTNSTCPTPQIGVFNPTIPCRDGGIGADAFCNPPSYCTNYGVCAASQVLPGATCDGGPRAGEYCDLYEELVLGHPQCGDGGHCVATVCPGATLPCEKPWTCDYSGHCLSNGYLPAGTDCIGDYACEKFSCDANGNCVDQNVTRSPGARCRPAANECDVAEFCGSPSVVPSNGRSDFDDYPNCGPDEKKPWGTACTYHPLGEDAPGKCSGGECVPYYCKNSIECPDGWVCGCPPGLVCPTPYCVPAPAEGGYGDVCTVMGRCNKDAESPGRACTSRQECDPGNIRPNAKCVQSSCDFNSGIRQGVGCESNSECRNATYPSGECVPDTRGDCGSIPGRTFDYVCCAGMARDGLGGTPALGVTGRCQECCGSGGAPDQNCRDQDATDGTTSFQCCDGKCTDVVSDIHNCVSCNYDGSGVDCTDLISACSPGVVKCDALNIGGGCVMTEYCGATAKQNGWTAASCDIPQVQVPVPGCDYCVFPTATPGKPCLTDAECGGFPGSCYHDPSLFCFADRQYAYTVAPECRAAPFSGCTPICTELDNAPNVGHVCKDDRTCNDSGDVCETDADCSGAGDYCIHECYGGTTCKSSCDLSGAFFGLSAFCFTNPTCQY
ncbi:MAG: hypothetical protein HYR83_01970, partial [Planctomycetes bacterium]|nr:hypothetical protein [Planctomycetota bacterium]